MNVLRIIFSTFLPTVSLSRSSSSSSFPISCNKSIVKYIFIFCGTKSVMKSLKRIFSYHAIWMIDDDQWCFSMSCFFLVNKKHKGVHISNHMLHITNIFCKSCFVSFFRQLFAPTDDIWLLTGNATVLSIFQKLGAHEKVWEAPALQVSDMNESSA